MISGQPIGLGRCAGALSAGAARAAVLEDRVRNLRRGKHQIDRAGQDRAARHAVITGLLRILRDHQAALFLDRLQPGAAVGAGSRKDDADGAGAEFLGQRMQQEIERQARAMALLRLRQTQGAGLDREIGPGGMT